MNKFSNAETSFLWLCACFELDVDFISQLMWVMGLSSLHICPKKRKKKKEKGDSHETKQEKIIILKKTTKNNKYRGFNSSITILIFEHSLTKLALPTYLIFILFFEKQYHLKEENVCLQTNL